ncbi:Holliday junction DNA helicase RuvA [Spiroplasma syrphidicola EA-1]|uniref:Holliday junction branch migration complex subunit RuvA n=1 Tax=Spiroplasma syrphidicola EA-1 TaxID=1276229 RepID=R4UJ85_9MOLU|nr:Holliday junction branch migration protein RuvA [Spiroplasma syrphidicola]AGM26185.1 Holliday junction DNA helicase RuvA [Spiroplasma syrphidicola EA-1]
MFNYLTGIVQNVASQKVWLDVNNQGYEIMIITYKPLKIKTNESYQFYTTLVNNDYVNYQWYGFLTLETRKLFLDLLMIPSIGVKTACLVLQQLSVEQLLGMIKNGAIEELCQLKGLKNHSARLIMTTLQKIYFRKSYNNIQNSMIDCLKKLGYSLPIIYRALNALPEQSNLEQYLTAVLKQISANNGQS